MELPNQNKKSIFMEVNLALYTGKSQTERVLLFFKDQL